MVTQNEEAVPATQEPISSPPVDGGESINDEIDRLNSAPSADSADQNELPPPPEEGASAEGELPPTVPPVAPPNGEAQTPVTQTPPAPGTPPETPQAPQYTLEQMQKMEKEMADYRQLQERARIDQEIERHQQQLEQQGYSEDQARELAQSAMQSRYQLYQQQQQFDQQRQEIEGKWAATMQFISKYGLTIDDVQFLQRATDPAGMEAEAKRLQDMRKDRAELDKLRQAQVPAQQFDNSQGEPQVASNDQGWLTRYNQGDRSPNATAAARRAAGLD